MTNHLINTTVTWLKYNGKIISSDSLEDNKLQIIRKTKIPVKEYKKIFFHLFNLLDDVSLILRSNVV